MHTPEKVKILKYYFSRPQIATFFSAARFRRYRDVNKKGTHA